MGAWPDGIDAITLFVEDLEDRKRRAAEHGIEPTTDETYGNGVRKLEFLDPDGNQFGIGAGPQEA